MVGERERERDGLGKEPRRSREEEICGALVGAMAAAAGGGESREERREWPGFVRSPLSAVEASDL